MASSDCPRLTGFDHQAALFDDGSWLPLPRGSTVQPYPVPKTDPLSLHGETAFRLVVNRPPLRYGHALLKGAPRPQIETALHQIRKALAREYFRRNYPGQEPKDRWQKELVWARIAEEERLDLAATQKAIEEAVDAKLHPDAVRPASP